jgi:hypothetical protein
MKTTFWGAVWRSLIVGALYTVALILTLLAIAAPTVLWLITNPSS